MTNAERQSYPTVYRSDTGKLTAVIDDGVREGEGRGGRGLTVAIDFRMAGSSGIGVYLKNIVPHLVRLRPDWRFVLIMNEGQEPRGDLLRPNVDTRTVKAGVYSVREQVELPGTVGAGADVFWSPHYNAPLLVRCPLVVTVHDVAHLVMRDGFGLAKRLYSDAMFSSVRRRSNALLFVSEFSRREFETRVGACRQPYWITPNAVSDIWHAPTQTVGRPKARRYAIAIGNVKPNKNFPRLIRAFAGIKDQTDLDLVIVGRRAGFLTGDPAVQEAGRELGDRLEFTGYVSDQALVDWVRNADMLVMPSLYEGFGIPPLEAMAVGCPTVVADIGALRESCGDASEFVNPVDTRDIARGILRVDGDKKFAASLVAKGHEQWRRTEWLSTAKTVARALEATATRGR